MSLDDIFGPLPGRPQHPDLTTLSDVVLELDGKTEDPDFSVPDHINTIVDVESIEYVAEQRTMRLLAALGIAPNPMVTRAFMSMYVDGFLTGVGYARRLRGPLVDPNYGPAPRDEDPVPHGDDDPPKYDVMPQAIKLGEDVMHRLVNTERDATVGFVLPGEIIELLADLND